MNSTESQKFWHYRYMFYFDGARGRMHYRRWPVDNAVATAALLPGLGQHSGHYHRFARSLGAAGIRLWALDTFGHGLSEGDPLHPGTLAELVADATAFLDRVRAEAAGPLVLMGHSLGAVTALGTLGAAVPDISAGTDLNTVEASYPLTPSVPHEALAGLVLSGVPRRALGGGRPDAPGTPLPSTLPILAVHGTDDRRAPVEAMREWAGRHPWARWHEYADTGHDVLHEPRYAEVTADVVAWLLERAHSAAAASR
ncbi:alpha-beta hydrolase superfamily lysophospholipase [Nocardia puris]|uniref:Alpha-beta hydrolase superfamily lysophospholipase n=2 Tax=Nocardia puris TaxID=208602 RepID=A0A366DTJ2_9NOCA|nr:alpha-beta hydrolase superfamily lysophospholipase [Nocardia puris]